MIKIADGTVKIEVLLDDSGIPKDVKKVEGRLSGIGGAAKRGIGTVAKLASSLGLVALAYKGIDMVKQSLDGAIDRYDTLNNFPRVMEQIGFDAESSQGAVDKLSDGIQGLPTRLDEVASTAQNIAIMTGDLDGAVDTTLALNNAFLASGATTDEAQRGLQQYVNMLSRGEVELDSWRTLQETMPFALRETAEAFGYAGESATNDLYDALKSGEITMSDFNDKILELDQAQGGFAETAKTASGGIRTAWTNMGTWVVMGVTDIMAAIDEALGGTGSIESAINGLKPVFESVFGFISNTAIPAVGAAIEWVREKFNALTPVFEMVKGALEPLFAVFEQTRQNIIDGLGPALDALMQIFHSLWPIIEMVAMVVGGVLLAAIVAGTSVTNGLRNAIMPLITAFLNLVDVVINVVNAIIAVLTGDFQGALDFWNAATESAVEFFKNLWDGIVGFIMGIVDAIIGWFEFLYDVLVGNSIIPDMVNAIIDWFSNLFQWAVDLVKSMVDGIVSWFKNLYNQVKNIFNSIKNFIQSVWNGIKNIITSVVNGIRNTITSVFNAIRSTVSSVMNGIRSVISSVWNGIRSVISSVLNGIRSVVSSVWNGIRSTISSVVNSIRSTISNIFNSLRGIVSSAFNGVKSAVSSGIRGALNVVTNMASSFFNAGKNIVTSIAGGIKGAIGSVTGAIGNVASKIRNFLPFSPAKEGALKDIMDVQIGESIAKAIENGESKAIKSMRGLTGKLADEADVDLLGGIKGLTANSVLSGVMPSSFAVQQEVMYKQANANRYDDSRVIQLLKELVEKNPNLYVDREKLGSVVDKEQARRIQLLEGWVAID